jgi:hypothetical protein
LPSLRQRETKRVMCEAISGVRAWFPQLASRMRATDAKKPGTMAGLIESIFQDRQSLPFISGAITPSVHF